MPAYNECATISQAVQRVLSAQYPCDLELIIVDDGSIDGTREILATMDDPRATMVYHECNRGKGAALQTAVQMATGTHIVPFDADLEYNPADLGAMMVPIMDGRCDVVYGVRLVGMNTRYQSYRHALGNRVLTFVARVLFDAAVSDIHTCLKIVPAELLRSLRLTQPGFGYDTELTAKLLRLGVRPFEVPVSYHSRSVVQGKKITWRDALKCLEILAWVRMSLPTVERRSARPPLPENERELAGLAPTTSLWRTGNEIG